MCFTFAWLPSLSVPSAFLLIDKSCDFLFFITYNFPGRESLVGKNNTVTSLRPLRNRCSHDQGVFSTRPDKVYSFKTPPSLYGGAQRVNIELKSRTPCHHKRQYNMGEDARTLSFRRSPKAAGQCLSSDRPICWAIASQEVPQGFTTYLCGPPHRKSYAHHKNVGLGFRL